MTPGKGLLVLCTGGFRMSLTCKVGGARETFEPGLGREVAGVLDNAFGARMSGRARALVRSVT